MAIDTSTFDGLSTELVLRTTLARIQGVAEDGAQYAANDMDRRTFLDIVAEATAALAEARDREVSEAEYADYRAWRSTQPTPSATVADDLPY